MEFALRCNEALFLNSRPNENQHIQLSSLLNEMPSTCFPKAADHILLDACTILSRPDNRPLHNSCDFTKVLVALKNAGHRS